MACVAVGTGAEAAPTEEAKAEADALFREGRELMARGHFAEACAKLERSEELDPGLGTLINLGACWEHVGKSALAYGTYKKAVRLGAEHGRSDRTHEAFERAKQLEPKIAKVTFPPSHVLVCSPSTSVDVEPGIAVFDPGTHACRLELEGRVRWSGTLTLYGGEEKALTPSPDAAPPPPPPAPPAPEKNEKSALRTGGWISLGIGIAALATGAAFAFLAKSTDNEAAGHCDARGCDPQGVTLGDEAKTRGNIASVLAIGGIVATGSGILMITF